jgi:hypothetical protein
LDRRSLGTANNARYGYGVVSRDGYPAVSPLAFVLCVYRCEDHDAFRKLWATPQETGSPKRDNGAPAMYTDERLLHPSERNQRRVGA